MFVGYFFSVRLDRDDRFTARLLDACGSAWETHVYRCPIEDQQGTRTVVPCIPALLQDYAERRAANGSVRAGVVFVVDMRPAGVAELRETLLYKAPRLEVVSLREKDLYNGTISFWLDYYGWGGKPPANVSEALEWFSKRFPSVIILPGATESAAHHQDFERPDLVLRALHFLARVYLEWWVARKDAKQPLNNNELLELTDPPAIAMSKLIEEATFEVSDSIREFFYVCPDGKTRNFSWHLKLSLAGPRQTRFHWRAHYAHERGAAGASLYIAHCGEHL